MVETLLITVFLMIVAFAAIQMCLIAVTDIISNEGAFAIERVAVVSKQNEATNNTLLAALYIFSREVSLSDLGYAPFRAWLQNSTIGKIHENKIVETYDLSLQYITRISFASILKPPGLFSLGNINFLKSTTRARMIKSPDEEYYNKAYKDGETF